jgi:hypothetical protein
MEGALLGFEEKIVVLDFLQDLIYSLLMYSFVIFGGYNKVIHIDLQPSLCDFFLKDVVYHCLKGHREFVRPKNITVGSKSPLLVLKVAFHLSPFLIQMLL